MCYTCGFASSQIFGGGAQISKVQRMCRAERRDKVRDESANCDVITEQGASASHMTAANLFDAIAGLP